MWPIILLAAAAAAESCDYSVDGIKGACINPKETGSTTFTSPPLFPGKTKFVYALDDITSEEYGSFNKTNMPDDQKDWKFPLVGWWLEYDEVSLNDTETEFPMWTDMTVFYTDAENKIGGSFNGCEGLLGKKCIDQLNKTILASTSYYHPIGGVPVSPDLSACPEDMRTDFTNVGVRNNTFNEADLFPEGVLSNDTAADAYDPPILPSGNSSFTYGRDFYSDQKFEERAKKAAVAFFLRHRSPDSYPSAEVPTPENAHMSLTMVCAQLSVTDDGDEEASGDDTDAGAGSDDSGETDKSGGSDESSDSDDSGGDDTTDEPQGKDDPEDEGGQDDEANQDTGDSEDGEGAAVVNGIPVGLLAAVMAGLMVLEL